MKNSLFSVILGLAFSSHIATAAVTFDWAYVGNAGNDADTPPTMDVFGEPVPIRDPLGAVDHTYRISKYEVTNTQYIEFLNAVDPTGTNTLDLYDAEMTDHGTGGILFQSGAGDGSKYQIKSGRDNNPVNFVDIHDAMRFTNWLENGQGSGGTESGVYTIGTGLNEVRNASASYFLPSDNEWFKAAYHKNDGVTDNYWKFATSTSADLYSAQAPGTSAPDPSSTANFELDDEDDLNGYNDGHAVTGESGEVPGQNYLTDVGAYSMSVSPYGTFDQNGNVREWTETVFISTTFSSGNFALGGDWRRGLAHNSSDNASFVYDSSTRTSIGVNSRGIGIRIAAAAIDLDGDFNGDGVVDAADYSVWRNNLGADEGDLLRGNGDGGTVSASDYDLWRSNYGEIANGALLSSGTVTAPEPSTMMLLGSVISGVSMLGRRRKRGSFRRFDRALPAGHH